MSVRAYASPFTAGWNSSPVTNPVPPIAAVRQRCGWCLSSCRCVGAAAAGAATGRAVAAAATAAPASTVRRLGVGADEARMANTFRTGEGREAGRGRCRGISPSRRR